MSSEQELEERLWKTLKSDMTLMLGLVGHEDGHCQPMTAQFAGEAERGPIWFFTATDTDLVKAMRRDVMNPAAANFVSRDHELFASLTGGLYLDDDRARIEQLWNRFVAAWFEGGKQDPKLQLLRFEPAQAQIWLNENTVFAGLKLLLGVDPKESYRDKVAEVDLQAASLQQTKRIP